MIFGRFGRCIHRYMHCQPVEEVPFTRCTFDSYSPRLDAILIDLATEHA